MTTTFSTIPYDLPDMESFHDDYKEAMWHNLSDEQSQKLHQLLDEKTEGYIAEKPIDASDILVDGDVLDIWDQIPEKARIAMEGGVRYLVSQQKTGDLLIGQWAEDHVSGGWRNTIGDASFWEHYHIYSHGKEPELQKGSINYKLLLHVIPGNTFDQKNVKISATLIEIPSRSAPRVSLLPSGMIFTKELTSQEFLDYFTVQKEHILVGN